MASYEWAGGASSPLKSSWRKVRSEKRRWQPVLPNKYALVIVQRDGRSSFEVVGYRDNEAWAWKEARRLTREQRGRIVYGVRPVKESVFELVMGGCGK